jgi:benzylsuccinate CoA-transferase BbsE subunit
VGIQGMVGALVALRARKLGAGGQLVDVSMQEAISNTLGNSQQGFVMDGTIYRRSGGARAAQEQGARIIWSCQDGYIAWTRMPRNMPMLHAWMIQEGFEPGFDGDEWATRAVVGSEAPSAEEVAALDARIEEFFGQKSKMYLYEEGQRRGVQVCPVSSAADLLENAQLNHRDFFQEVTEADLGVTIKGPGAPFRMSQSDWIAGVPSPQPGQHTDDVRAGIAN